MQPALLLHPEVEAIHPVTQRNKLHQAVLEDRLDSIHLLKHEEKLRHQRDCWGLTPAELASYLHKKKSMAALSDFVPSTHYLQQENVQFEEPQRIQRLAVEHLSTPVFSDSTTLQEILECNKMLKEADRIPQDRVWLGIYYQRELLKHLHPRVVVRWVDDEIGFGVFAGERIQPCTFLGEYTGVVQQRQKKHMRGSNYCVRYTAWPMGKRVYVIDAERMGNFTRHINHSDRPNAVLVCAYFQGLPRMLILSLQEIPEGTQITFDYGTTFWKQSPYITKRCL
jgi:uncharacterized protein